MNRRNPDKYYEKVAEMVREGTGFPQVHNDAWASLRCCSAALPLRKPEIMR